jgi:hypothetical protein
MQSLTVAKLNFMKLKLTRELSVKKVCAEILEGPKKSQAAARKDRHCLSHRKAHIFTEVLETFAVSSVSGVCV